MQELTPSSARSGECMKERCRRQRGQPGTASDMGACSQRAGVSWGAGPPKSRSVAACGEGSFGECLRRPC